MSVNLAPHSDATGIIDAPDSSLCRDIGNAAVQYDVFFVKFHNVISLSVHTRGSGCTCSTGSTCRGTILRSISSFARSGCSPRGSGQSGSSSYTLSFVLSQSAGYTREHSHSNSFPLNSPIMPSIKIGDNRISHIQPIAKHTALRYFFFIMINLCEIHISGSDC